MAQQKAEKVLHGRVPLLERFSSSERFSLAVKDRVDILREALGRDYPIKICGVGAGAWGSVFMALLQDAYGELKDQVHLRIWRRPGKALDRETADALFAVINRNDQVLSRLVQGCAYLKYVEARMGKRVLYADEVLRDGFCINMLDTPLCPLHVVTNLQEAVWDADIVVNGLPSTEVGEVFSEIGRVWHDRRGHPPIIISLAKGVEARLHPMPHLVTPSIMIHQLTGVPPENILYLGGPNIASEVYNHEYANARICGAAQWREPLALFLSRPHFLVWDNSDIVTHEVMGGLKNVYAIGAGIVAFLTRESATSKAVYFSHATSEMVFITHLLEKSPEGLAGPLLADTYVTLLKGRNAWYGQELASGRISLADGDIIKGKGMIQGVSAVNAFYILLSQPSLTIPNNETAGSKVRHEQPIDFCPILKVLYKVLIARERGPAGVLDAIRDENMQDPRQRIEVALKGGCYFPQLLTQYPPKNGHSI